MKCPKCGEDLIHLSGRYLCSDCGNEVPESEVCVGGWNFSEDGKEKECIPGDVQVNNFDDAITDSEDYLVEYAVTPDTTDSDSAELSETAKEAPTETKEESTEEVDGASDLAVIEEAPRGFYTAADINTEDANVDAVQINVPVPEEATLEEEVTVEKNQVPDESKITDEEVSPTASEDMLNDDLLDNQNSQTPVTIAPIDEELLTSPVMDSSQSESEQSKSSSRDVIPAWVRLLPITFVVVVLLGGFTYLIVDYVRTNNGGTNTEIENPGSTSWVDYKNTEHSFGVYLPERPKSAKSTLKVSDQDLVATIFESTEGDNMTYRVHVVELSESLAKQENDDLMALLAENFTKKDNFALGSQEEVSVDTAFGLDIEAKGDQKSLNARLVRVENKVYILSLVYNSGESTDKYQDFVRSFKIIQESI